MSATAIKLGVAASIAVATVLLAGALAVQLSWPAAWPGPATSEVHARLADDALTGGADLVSARAETLAILDQGPLNAGAWAQMADIQAYDGQRLDAAAIQALDRSYAVAPYGPDVSKWRVRFAFEHWLELTPEVRAKAIAELDTFSRYRSWLALPVVRSVRNPTGRLAATMAFNLGQPKNGATRTIARATRD